MQLEAAWLLSVRDRTDALGKCQHLVDGGRPHLQADGYKAASRSQFACDFCGQADLKSL